MRGVTVTRPDGTVKAVKNLGWLLRSWKRVETIKVREPEHGDGFDAELIVILRDGTIYETPFASRLVLWSFLNRPVFEGLDVEWFGEKRTLAKRVKVAW